MSYVTTYFRVSKKTGEIKELSFSPYHADEMQVAFFDKESNLSIEGIQRIAALELVNRWNFKESAWVYYIKP